MKCVLAAIFAMFPWMACAEILDRPQSSTSALNVKPDAVDVWNEADQDNVINEWSLAPYGNPYAPSSSTNFGPFIGPYHFLHDRQDVDRYGLQSPSAFNINADEHHRFSVSSNDGAIVHHHAVHEILRR
jgi:hypothetical protein